MVNAFVALIAGFIVQDTDYCLSRCELSSPDTIQQGIGRTINSHFSLISLLTD